MYAPQRRFFAVLAVLAVLLAALQGATGLTELVLYATPVLMLAGLLLCGRFVPNERDDKGTVKVDLRLPHGFYFLSYKKVPGWKVKITKTKLANPVTLEGLKIDREVTRVVWTGNRKQGGVIGPDQFEEFPLSVRVPDGKAGDQLVFRAIQTYRGGERVRWTGAPGADTPAPRVTLTAPAQEG